MPEKEENVVPFKLITGGKPPRDPDDWLSELAEGTVFLVQHKNNVNEFSLGQFILVNKFEKSILILTTTNQQMYSYVNPLRFCRSFTLWEIIGKVDAETPEQEETEENLDVGDRPV